MSRKHIHEPLSDEEYGRLAARLEELEKRRRLRGQDSREHRNIRRKLEEHRELVAQLVQNETPSHPPEASPSIEQQSSAAASREERARIIKREESAIDRAQAWLDEKVGYIREESKPRDFMRAREHYNGALQEVMQQAQHNPRWLSMDVFGKHITQGTIENLYLNHGKLGEWVEIDSRSPRAESKQALTTNFVSSDHSFAHQILGIDQHTGPYVVIINRPISQPWAGLLRIQHIAYLNAVSEIIAQKGGWTYTTADRMQADRESDVVLSLVASAMSSSLKPAVSFFEFVRDVYSRSDVSGGESTMHLSPETLAHITAEISRAISIEAPRSKAEAVTRVRACLDLAECFCGSAVVNSSLPEEPIGERCAQILWERVPEVLQYKDVQEELEVLAPELLAQPDGLLDLVFLRMQGRVFCMYSNQSQAKADLLKSHLEKYTFDRSVSPEMDIAEIQHALYLSKPDGMSAEEFDVQTRDHYVSVFSIPTLAEMEQQLFSPEYVEGRFLQKEEEVEEPEEDIDELSKGKEGGGEERRIPRLRALRNVLLRNAIPARFAWDDAEAIDDAQQEDFTNVPEGHYAIVTLSNPGLQFVISDDHGKGTYVVYNTIDVRNYTGISVRDLRENCGGTRVKWDTQEQFMHSIENTIRLQTENPKRIYPVNVRCETPLDHFPSEECLEILRRDFQQAAERVKRGDKPWTFRVGDFQKIESGDFLWGFGGNACGVIQLDRLAREFGLRETETGVAQHNFRRLILKTVLYEMYPEYRKLQEERDRESAATSEQEMTAVSGTSMLA